MSWVLVIGAGWLLLSVLTAVVIGRSVRMADQRAESAADAPTTEPNFVVDSPQLHVVPPPATQPPVIPAPPRQAPDTIPGIPAARPKLVKPPVPRSENLPARKTGLG
jgi:hypothetical protein